MAGRASFIGQAYRPRVLLPRPRAAVTYPLVRRAMARNDGCGAVGQAMSRHLVACVMALTLLVWPLGGHADAGRLAPTCGPRAAEQGDRQAFPGSYLTGWY